MRGLAFGKGSYNFFILDVWFSLLTVRLILRISPMLKNNHDKHEWTRVANPTQILLFHFQMSVLVVMKNLMRTVYVMREFTIRQECLLTRRHIRQDFQSTHTSWYSRRGRYYSINGRTEVASGDGKSRRMQRKTHFIPEGLNRLYEGENGGQIRKKKRGKEKERKKKERERTTPRAKKPDPRGSFTSGCNNVARQIGSDDTRGRIMREYGPSW